MTLVGYHSPLRYDCPSLVLSISTIKEFNSKTRNNVQLPNNEKAIYLVSFHGLKRGVCCLHSAQSLYFCRSIIFTEAFQESTTRTKQSLAVETLQPYLTRILLRAEGSSIAGDSLTCTTLVIIPVLGVAYTPSY